MGVILIIIIDAEVETEREKMNYWRANPESRPDWWDMTSEDV